MVNSEKTIHDADARPQWISVEERMPEQFVSVLLYVPELAPLPTVIEGYAAKNGDFYGVGYGLNGVKATHWVPMPDPPGGNGDGGAEV